MVELRTSCALSSAVLAGYAAVFFFQAEDGIRDDLVTGVQTCALPIFPSEFRVVKHGSKSQERANAEDNKRERLAGAGQFSDNCAYYSQEYKSLALLKVGKRIGERGAARMPRDYPRAAHCQNETKEEAKNEIRMPKLFDALLDRHP